MNNTKHVHYFYLIYMTILTVVSRNSMNNSHAYFKKPGYFI